MVLVDTSVWIRFISNRSPYAEELHHLLARDQVAGHELVYGELLCGDRRGRRKLLELYQEIAQTRLIPHSEIVAFVRARKLHGRGAGWIDVHLLATALVDRLRLWTADSRVSVIATELGIAYQPSGSGGYVH